MLKSDMYFENWHMHWLESSLHLAWEQQGILWHLHTMPSPINLEWVLMEKYIWSLSLLFPKGRSCFSKHQMFAYSCQQMPTSIGTIKWLQKTLGHNVNNHRPWQEAAKLHIHFPVFRAETRPWWMQAAADPWGSFILTPDYYRCLQLLRAVPKLMASIQLGLGSGMTPRIPHMRQDPPPASAKLIWGLDRKCQESWAKGSFSWLLLLRPYSLWPRIWW